MKFGLSDDQLRQVQTILSKYPAITEAVVFGSRAMGNYKEASDVDVALKGNITLSLVADVKYELEEDTYLPFFFDIIAYGIIDAPKLKEHIDKYGEVLYRAGWKEYVFSDFVEIAPKVILQSGSDYSFVEMAELQDGNKFCESSVIRPFDGGGTKFQNGDTLFARITPCLENGKICQVRNLTNGKGFGSTEFHVFRGKDGQSDTDFIYYLSRWNEVRDFAEANLHGTSGRQRVPREAFDALRMNLPPLSEQRAIAAVLSSLDDKIDLLHRQNKTLEGMASALWRKMFVEDASPTWKTGKLGDYGAFKNGINYSRNENGDTEYSILNVRDIVESKYLTGNAFEKISVNASKATPYLLQTNDIVIVRSASPGESLIVLGESDNLLYSGFSIRFRCHSRQHALFVFQFLQSYKKEMDIFSDGTTLKNINQGILNSIDLVVPESKAILEFNAKAGDIYSKIMLNQRQVHNLTRLRDALLPKLITGEIRVNI